MMPLALYLAFIGTSAVLLLIPGPNVSLIVSTGIAHGRIHGLVTVAGTSVAMVLQLGLTVLGMTSLLTSSAGMFEWLRWAGVVYLCFLGLRAWFTSPREMITAAPERSPLSVFLRGFLISLTNPKTLLFYGAFLPQFISATSPPLPQLVLLSASFLALALVFDGSWALLGGRFGAALCGRRRLRDRIEGALLMFAGLGLALARKT